MLRPRTRIRIRAEIAKRGKAGDVFLPDNLMTKLRRFRAFKKKRGESLESNSPHSFYVNPSPTRWPNGPKVQCY